MKISLVAENLFGSAAVGGKKGLSDLGDGPLELTFLDICQERTSQECEVASKSRHLGNKQSAGDGISTLWQGQSAECKGDRESPANLFNGGVRDSGKGMCCNFQKAASERWVGSIRLRLMHPPRTAC